MDPVSHIAFGRTLIAWAGTGARARGTVGAAVLGSLAPDVDAVAMPFGWDRYLRVHEIGTHSIAGTLACACLTALVVRAARRETPFARLLAAAWLGTASHVILDLVSGARLRLGWPLSDRHWSLPLVAMADPALLALLVAGVLLLSIARPPQHRTAAGAALAVVAAFLSVKSILALSAVSAYEAARGPAAVDARVVEAGWGRLREWTVFDRTDDELRAWHVTAGRPGSELVLHWPRTRPTGLAGASQALPTVRNFLHTHDLALVSVTSTADGSTTVLWSDIRYCWDPAARPAEGVPILSLDDGRRLACGLWFGGEFDGRGRVVRLIVRVGAITQTRDAGT
jgi:membrane-bound metal-dependent hydrolase YbcI (DUF457 family)